MGTIQTLFAFMSIVEPKEVPFKDNTNNEAVQNFIRKRTELGVKNGKILRRETYRYKVPI